LVMNAFMIKGTPTVVLIAEMVHGKRDLYLLVIRLPLVAKPLHRTAVERTSEEISSAT